METKKFRVLVKKIKMETQINLKNILTKGDFMKTLKIPAFVKKPLMMFVLLTGFFGLSACDNKNGGGGGAVVSPYSYGAAIPASCAGCFGAMGNIFRATIDQNNVNVDMTFWGDTSVFNFNNNTYPPVTNYMGSTQVNGFIEFRTPQGGGSCTIPAGRYDLRTLTAGQWNMGSASGGQVDAIIPGYTLKLAINQFVVGPRPAGYQDWISVPRPHVGKGFLSFYVQAINNYPCSFQISVQQN